METGKRKAGTGFDCRENLASCEFRIERVLSREVLDSRGNPTVQVDLYTRSGFGRFSVPSGASKGHLEALELRDGDRQRYAGLGVQKAVDNVNRILGPKILGMDAREQAKIDRILIELDGTENKGRLGANAILGVSIALARASADTANSPIYRALAEGRRPSLPLPLMNIINGGKHAGNDLSFQEFMVIPAGFRTFKEALRSAAEIYHALRLRLEAKYGKSAVNVGDEGAFAPPIDSVEEALGQISDAVEEAGYSPGQNVILGTDAAADSFYSQASGKYTVDGKVIDSGELLELYVSLQEKFPLKSIEDPFHDEDFDNFSRITEKLGGKVQVVGDDLFVTNIKRVAQGIRAKAANALLVKINQIGTLTETIEAVETARKGHIRLGLRHKAGGSAGNSPAGH